VRRLLLVSILALALGLGVAAPAGAAATGGPSTRVVGGTEAAPGSFPYLAWIYYHDEIDNRVCTGTVVSSKVILTAAHCVMRVNSGPLLTPSAFTVLTGALHISDPAGTVSGVSGIAISPTYRTETGRPAPIEGDAAVLILDQPTAAPPVRLAATKVWSAGTPATYAGWGETREVGTGDGLRYGLTTVKEDVADCGTGLYIAAAMVCARDVPLYRSSPCFGDSGGPLVMTAPGTTSEPLEIGVLANSVAGDCSPEAASVWTRSDTIAAWVAGEIAANPGPPPAPAVPPAAPPSTAPTGGSGSSGATGSSTAATPVTPSSTALTHMRARETRPVIDAGLARLKATEVLRKSLGASFAKRQGYKEVCKAMNLHKQECTVSWKTDDARFKGIVHVFGTWAGEKPIWHTDYAITESACEPARSASARPVCRAHTLRG
jgi:hypothetical protein